MQNNLFEQACEALQCCDPAEKVQLSYQLADVWAQQPTYPEITTPPLAIGEAGRPLRPELVSPRELSRRSVQTQEGRNILAHALAHIEFNAINLALDAVYRFRDMPVDYYTDWIRVAREEAYHFSLLNDYLQQHGCHYGAYTAHNGLWEMARKTAHDVLVRMALVPRVLEARGLDVTPGIIARLEQVDDQGFVDCLQIIHRDEIGHVAIGSHWFKHLCQQRNLEPLATFKQLIQDYMKGNLKGPFDEVARQQAGFSATEMQGLNAMTLEA